MNICDIHQNSQLSSVTSGKSKPFLLCINASLRTLTSPREGAAPDLSLTDLIVSAAKRQVHVWLMGWDNSASEKVLGGSVSVFVGGWFPWGLPIGKPVRKDQ